jgi:hypothetical protein
MPALDKSGRGVRLPRFFDHLAKLGNYGQNGQSKLDHDHPQDYKILMVKIVNPNLIMTVSTIPNYFVVEIFEIVEISVKIRGFYGQGHGWTPSPPTYHDDCIEVIVIF